MLFVWIIHGSRDELHLLLCSIIRQNYFYLQSASTLKRRCLLPSAASFRKIWCDVSSREERVGRVCARDSREITKALEPEPHFEPLGTGAGWCIQVTVAKGSLWNLKLPDSLLLYLWIFLMCSAKKIIVR